MNRLSSLARVTRIIIGLVMVAGLILAGGLQARAATGASGRVSSGPDGTAAFAPPPAAVSVSPDAVAGSPAIAQLAPQIAAEQQTVAGLAGQRQQLTAQASADNAQAAALQRAGDAAQNRASALEQQAQSVSQAIAEHNAQPHTFQLPAQQAALASYDAEASRLQAQQAALKSQLGSVNSQLTQVTNGETQLASAEAQLNSGIAAYNQQVAAASASVQALIAQVQQAYEQSAAAQQAALASADSPAPAPPPAAVAMNAGADAASPPPAIGQAATQAAASPGGDAASQGPQVDALTRYGQQAGTQIATTQPGTAVIAPSAIAKLPPAQVAALGSPTVTYNGLAREKNGKYQAIEVQPPGSALPPQTQAFESALQHGGTAQTRLGGSPVSIDSVKNVSEDDVAPCSPSGGSSFAPGIRVLLANGTSAPISILAPGDKILATNTNTGETSPESVSAVEVNHDHDLYNLRIQSGRRTSVIHTTANHLFRVSPPGQWQPADNLKKGDRLKTVNGTVALSLGGSVPNVHSGRMWDLSVPGGGDHDFYVDAGSASVLVHNDSCRWTIGARMRTAGPGDKYGLPSQGKIRYVPPRGYNPENPLPRGPQNGYIDRFGNEWVAGPSRTQGEPFEWDVQLSRTGKSQIGQLSHDGNMAHVNVSPLGKVTH